MQGEDCNTCDNLQYISALRLQAQQKAKQQAKKEVTETKKKNDQPPKVAETKEASKDDDQWEMKPPASFEEVGQSTWTLIHTMAAYYPEKPSETQKRATSQFIQSLTEVYPCKNCAKDLKEELVEVPPRLDNQKEFAKWACDLHNVVNVKLGKPIFPCEFVDKRWKFSKDESYQFD